MLQEYMNDLTIFADICRVYDSDDTFKAHEELWNYYKNIKK